MSFRLVQKLVTLDDLERRKSPNSRVISLSSVVSERITYKWLKIHQYFLQRKCRPQNLVCSDISFMAILAGDHPSERVKVTHSAPTSENLINNQP